MTVPRVREQAAAMPKGSLERMVQVVAFSASTYASCQRTRRSLNPLLSETFELVYPEKGLRLVSEHVSLCAPDWEAPLPVAWISLHCVLIMVQLKGVRS